MNQTLVVSLAGLAERINAEHEQCEVHMRAGVDHAIKAGELLIEAKSLCAHGEWGAWLQANCAFAERTAQAYMRVARNREALEAKAQRVADLPFREALNLLSGPRSVKPAEAYTDPWDEEVAELNRLIQHVQSVLGNATLQELADAVRIAEYCVKRAQELWLQSKGDYLGVLAELGDYLPDESPFMRIRIDPWGCTFNRRDWQKVDDWVDAFAQAAQERYDELVAAEAR